MEPYVSLLATVLAILSAPLIALRVNVWLGRRTERLNRKLEIFRSIMATRSTGLSPEHVTALNKIDVEFYDVPNVQGAWLEYLDHLGTASTIATDNKDAWDRWGEKKADLLTELILRMAEHLNYKFDKVHLKKGHYYPKGYVDIETEHTIIRKGLVKIFENQFAFPILAFIAERPKENIS
jgi:hypothetical protein